MQSIKRNPTIPPFLSRMREKALAKKLVERSIEVIKAELNRRGPIATAFEETTGSSE